jgi:hypothetical protein
MEGIETVDMAPGIFYGTLQDRSYGSSRCVIEEDPMDPVASSSLLLALLQGAEKPYAKETREAKYRRMTKKRKKEVQKKLYDALYVITEHPDLPQNRQLSMAIGRVLARAIREDNKPPDKTLKALIDELRQQLQPVVTEAIDET